MRTVSRVDLQVQNEVLEDGEEGRCVLAEYALGGHHIGLRFIPRAPWSSVEEMFERSGPLFNKISHRVLAGSGEIKVQFAVRCRFRKTTVNDQGKTVST